MLDHLAALIAPPRCLACRATVPVGRPLCAGCRGELVWLAARQPPPGWAAVAFDGPARALVHALKFARRTAAAGVMAAQIAANAPPGLLAPGAILVPVPAHPARARARGFDQAALLAAGLARRTGLAVGDVLRRRGGGGPQVGSGRGARLARDLGITVRRRAKEHVPGRVVLVDDVVTTGATLAACERALDAAGANFVAAVAYARALG